MKKARPNLNVANINGGASFKALLTITKVTPQIIVVNTIPI